MRGPQPHIRRKGLVNEYSKSSIYEKKYGICFWLPFTGHHPTPGDKYQDVPTTQVLGSSSEMTTRSYPSNMCLSLMS